MQPVKLAAICAVLVVMLVTSAFISRSLASKKQAYSTKGSGFAVLELFTSEGCSSCPPAEALLARIQKEAGNKPVYFLAYHVDYWNRLGWKDVFSDPQFSKRQYQYSRQLGSQVYTPQLVVNGRSEYIGADEPAVSNAIGNALSSTATLSLDIQATLQSGGIRVDYQLTGNPGNSRLVVAAVQKQAISKIERGENEGRTLAHLQVVRQLQAFDLKPGNHGAEQLHTPAGFNAPGWEIIAMVQDAQTGAIHAAARAAIAK